MNRMFAIIEREMRKFFRSPTLMIMSLMMPILQLVIIGNAFGGKIVGTHVAVVDYDHGPQAVKVREAFDAVAANIKTFSTIEYQSEVQAREDVRTGKIDAAVIIPAQYSRRVYAQDAPKLGFVVDNSDLFTSSSLEAEMQSLVDAMNAPQIQDRLAKTIALEVVELYPYVNYLKYLLPMTVALAMYISVMIGGGMLYIDDKARGVHEGYLVTPITKLELVFGLNIAGAIKATLSGISIVVIGSLIAGLGVVFHPMIMLQTLCLIIAGSIAFNGMMFLLMVRVDDPLVPRAMFGMLNVLLLYPSGAMYPTASFPKWMQAIGVVDPFTYVIHGFKAVLLKDGGWVAIWQRPAVSHGLRNRHAAGGHAAVQAHAVANALGIVAGAAACPALLPQLFPIPHFGRHLVRQRKAKLMREHAHLPAMVGFVRNHVAQHFRANRPGPSPAVSQELLDAATVPAERFGKHLRAASAALGQCRTCLARRAMRVVELRRNLQMRSREPDPLAADIVHVREDGRNAADLARRFRLLQTAGSRCSMSIWFKRSFTAKICTAARPNCV